MYHCISKHHKTHRRAKPTIALLQYEARKYGVRSGMAGFIAKKLCPHLIL